MSISTKTGDKKETSTGSGKRVSKASDRVRVIGTADELVSLLGVAKAQLSAEARVQQELRPIIHRIQNLLFVLLAEIADPDKLKVKRFIERDDVLFLEQVGTDYESRIPRITYFIVPGEEVGSAYLDYARAVARRLERDMIACADEIQPSAIILQFCNRLSDTLYLLARAHDLFTSTPLVQVSYE